MMPIASTHFYLVLQVFAQVSWQEREIKGIEYKKLKLSVFASAMILCTENLRFHKKKNS